MTKESDHMKTDLTNVKIGGIPFNLEIALKRLKQDIRDDWFPDFLEFQDLFGNKDYFLNHLNKYTNSNDLYELVPQCILIFQNQVLQFGIHLKRTLLTD